MRCRNARCNVIVCFAALCNLHIKHERTVSVLFLYTLYVAHTVPTLYVCSTYCTYTVCSTYCTYTVCTHTVPTLYVAHTVPTLYVRILYLHCMYAYYSSRSRTYINEVSLAA